MLLLVCLLVGAVLGQRFKVAVLIPSMAVTVAVEFAYGGTFRQIIGATLVAAMSLQIGYFAGVSMRYLMAAARTSRMEPILSLHRHPQGVSD